MSHVRSVQQGLWLSVAAGVSNRAAAGLIGSTSPRLRLCIVGRWPERSQSEVVSRFAAVVVVAAVAVYEAYGMHGGGGETRGQAHRAMYISDRISSHVWRARLR